MISGVDFVTIASTDLARSIAFYEETLGLERRGAWGQIGMEFQAGNLTVAVMDSVKFGMEATPNNHPIAFHVDDFEGAKATLAERGVEFVSDTIDSGVCHQAIFEDPDGNVLGLHHRYA